jgi:hypothetical protein
MTTSPRQSFTALEAHFGLGQRDTADVKVTLPSGKTVSFADLKADQFLDLNLNNSRAFTVKLASNP